MYRFVYCIYIYIYIYIVYIESAAKLTLCGCLRSLVRSVKTALAYNKTQVFIRSHLCYLLNQVNCKFISKFSLHLFLLHSKKRKTEIYMNYIVSHDAYLSKEIIHRRRRSWFSKPIVLEVKWHIPENVLNNWSCLFFDGQQWWLLK